MLTEGKKGDNIMSNDPKIESGPPKKKPNKKKKKSAAASGPVEPIDPYYEQVMQTYPVLLRNTKAKGRNAAASKQLDEGTTIFFEQATAFVVRSEYIDEHCHVCLDPLTTKMMCSDCRKSFYCSKECFERDNDTHTLVCSPMAVIDSIARATDVDVDLLRLITLLLARRQQDNDNNDATDDDKHHDDDDNDTDKQKRQATTPTPFWCTKDLISHRNHANPAFVRVVKEAGKSRSVLNVKKYKRKGLPLITPLSFTKN